MKRFARIPRILCVPALPALLLLFFSVRPADAIPASTANDVCAPSADPCVVTQDIEVADGSTLDFGARTLSLTGGGTLDFGSGSGTVYCGEFNANVGNNGVAILARGPDGFGGTAGGFIQIEARRACSGQTSRLCLGDFQCNLGTCSVRRCSDRLNRDCAQDADCQVGPCVTGRCAGLPSAACTVDADCNFGTCPASNGCASNPALLCASDAECNFGTCSVGSGKVIMSGPISGNADEPAVVIISAAGDISMDRTANLTGTTPDSDGGELEMESFLGSVTMDGKTVALGGGFGQGGSVRLTAGLDVVLNKEIDADGGDFDGGIVEFSAGRDVKVNDDINASSVNGEGFGGEVLIDAGNDVLISGTSGTAGGTTRIGTEGHEGVDNFGGDGGAQEFVAGRDVVFSRFTIVESNGASPDGIGGDVLVSSGRDFSLNGTLQAKARGIFGGGGFLEFTIGRDSIIGGNGTFDVTGFEAAGGSVELTSGGGISYSGDTDVTGSVSQGGTAGSVSFVSGGDVVLDGGFLAGGAPAGLGDSRIDVDACRIHLTANTFVNNVSQNGTNVFTVGESMIADAGSRVQADAATGSNSIVHRDPIKPPLLNGTMTPVPSITVNTLLSGCPVCGNGELDQGETCDDGNTTAGDGCSSDCQDEGCIADTLGYPANSLCDDQSSCTADSCNTVTHACEHEFLCSDGIACTVDECVEDQCVSTPSDALCSDGNVCTDDICTVPGGCVSANNTAACDDGLFCTAGDTCAGGVCVSGASRNCDDGVACTVDSCNEAANTCENTPDHGVCDDAAFCNGVETCNATTGCQAGTPVNCSHLDDQCSSGVCDEAGDVCRTEPANEGGACDDGAFCTTGDQCSGGACIGSARDCGDGVACTVDTCDEGADTCVNSANDAVCDDGAFCNGLETCDAVSDCQPGTGLDCSQLDDQCAAGVCDEDSQGCMASPINEGLACDDGDVCTQGDVCSAGSCTGNVILGCAVCGDGVTAGSEECDDGDTVWANGEYCRSDCSAVSCGRPLDTQGARPLASDALFTLRAAVRLETCDVRVCDVAGPPGVFASDALTILAAAVGTPVQMNCPVFP